MSVVLGLKRKQPLFSRCIVTKPFVGLRKCRLGWLGWTEPEPWEQGMSCRKRHACCGSGAIWRVWLPSMGFWKWQVWVKTWALWSNCTWVHCCGVLPWLTGSCWLFFFFFFFLVPFLLFSFFKKFKHDWHNIMLVSGEQCHDLIFVYLQNEHHNKSS